MKILLTVMKPLLALLLLIWCGCARGYVITTDLQSIVDGQASCRIGPIVDNLPIKTGEGSKPTIEEINKLKNRLEQQIIKRDLFRMDRSAEESARYEVRGGILDYNKGSGVTRFFIGTVGNARIIVNLKLIDITTGEVIFAGNFKAKVSDGLVNGDAIFTKVAKSFTKQLEKKLKKMRKYNRG